MNIHNVHVNRSPVAGYIEDISHTTGSHLPAFKKESDRNERNRITLVTDIGEVEVVQIAGTVARRIDCYLRRGEEVEKGQRIGMIKLGSRVDTYLPREKVKVTVDVGKRVKAGESQIAEVEGA